ncbi:MAG: ATP-binding protein, partial [Ktedonobacterales bacterium]
FLGVLAVGSAARLHPRHLLALEEIAGLASIAADRDRLLSYSRSQEALAQTVVRHAPVAIAVLTGPEHTFALANPAFSRLLGTESIAPLIGQRLEGVAPQHAMGLAASLRLDAVLSGGEHQAMLELPIHTVDRGLTYWNVTSSPLPGRGPEAAGVLVAAVEVTRQVLARQRAQEVAEMAQERIGQMMTLHATSLEVASQLGADSRELVADILRRSISLLGARAGAVYAREARSDELEVIVSQGLRGEYAGSRIRLGDGLAGQVAQTGKGLIVDDYRASPLRAAIYEGEDFRAVIAVPLIHHGRVLGVLDVLDDSERRAFTDDDLWLLDLFAAQAAQAIENARTFVELERAYRKQRELDRMKDDFIATASHELRTPLTGIQGFLDLLLDYPGSRDDPRALDFLARASESAQELANIAERLLQTSRLDSGRLELHIGSVRLASVVEDVLRSYRELQDAQGGTHELIAEVPPKLYMRADLGRLKEVLDNLVGNAIKYSPHGGRVLVRCAAVEGDAYAGEDAPVGPLSERPTLVLPPLASDTPDENIPDAPHSAVRAAAGAEQYLSITVSDEGLGIPRGDRERLFGRFSRGDSARASQIRGTGLGLYICRQMVRAMAGDIWLHESTPGVGSTFALVLPAGAPSESGAHAAVVATAMADR